MSAQLLQLHLVLQQLLLLLPLLLLQLLLLVAAYFEVSFQRSPRQHPTRQAAARTLCSK